MVEHIVCFKLKDGVGQAEADRLVGMLKALKGQIPEIIDLSAGQTFTPERGQGFSIGLVVRFANKEGLAVYGPHPQHQPVKEYVGQICESALAVDYEF